MFPSAILAAFLGVVIIALSSCANDSLQGNVVETCDEPVNKEWSPFDDPTIEIQPTRALDHDYNACKNVEIKIKKRNVALLDFFAAKDEGMLGYIFIAVNGEARGMVLETTEKGCLRKLANFAFDALAPADWERRGPKFLLTSGGLPVRNAEDIEKRARRELYVLNSRQTWVWPAHRIGLRFEIQNVSMTTVSEFPRVFALDHLLKGEDCDAIINKYEGQLVPSPEKHYSDEYKDHRTSETGWMEDHPLRYVIQRVLRLPYLNYVENLQFLKYKVGKWYKHHHDYFHYFRVNYVQSLRRWMKMRIASIYELPDDWVPETEIELKWAESLRKAKASLLKAIEAPRKSGKILIRDAPLLKFVTDLESRIAQGILKIMIYSILDDAATADVEISIQTYQNLVKASNADLSRRASAALASIICKEINLDSSDCSVLHLGTEVGEIDILETEPIESKIGPNRHATVLPYLNDVEEGGETALPRAKRPHLYLGKNFDYPKHAGIPECSKGLILKPKKGSASLFYHRLPSGELDELSLHAGCPPKKGTKYAINGFTWDSPSGYGFSHYTD